MVTIFKNITNVFILAGDWYWFAQSVTPKVLVSLALTVLGAVAAAGADTRFSATGYAWMAANCAATAGYVLYMRQVTKTTKLSEFGGSLYNNVLAVPLTLVASVMAGEVPDVLRMPQWSLPGFVLALFVSGVVGFFLSICSLWCMKATSASTYAIIGALNKVPLAVIGVVVFADPLTLKLGAYIALGLGAGVFYAMAKVCGCGREYATGGHALRRWKSARRRRLVSVFWRAHAPRQSATGSVRTAGTALRTRSGAAQWMAALLATSERGGRVRRTRRSGVGGPFCCCRLPRRA